MESMNPIEKLNLLEQKIALLVGALKAQKELNLKLTEEKLELLNKFEMLENSLLKGTQSIEELNQERILTKMVVDDLISSIDKLVEGETRG